MKFTVYKVTRISFLLTLLLINLLTSCSNAAWMPTLKSSWRMSPVLFSPCFSCGVGKSCQVLISLKKCHIPDLAQITEQAPSSLVSDCTSIWKKQCSSPNHRRHLSSYIKAWLYHSSFLSGKYFILFRKTVKWKKKEFVVWRYYLKCSSILIL